MNIDTINKNSLEILIDEKRIAEKVDSIAIEISRKFKGKIPIIVGVLNGSFLFLADLVRKLDIEFEIDFIKLSSYGSDIKSSGTVRLIKDISADITGRDVIVVEDIVDSGLTVKFLKTRFEEAGTKSVTFVTCLFKNESVMDLNFKLDYIGFNIPNIYVVGYGLDLDQKFRGLSSIYSIKKEN